MRTVFLVIGSVVAGYLMISLLILLFMRPNKRRVSHPFQNREKGWRRRLPVALTWGFWVLGIFCFEFNHRRR